MHLFYLKKFSLSLSLFFLSLLLCTVTAQAENKSITAYSSNSDVLISSFAASYGWDNNKMSTWEWEGEGNTSYHRLNEYQDSLLKESYQQMADYTLSKYVTTGEDAKDEEDSSNATPKNVEIIAHGNYDDTMKFIKELGIELGSKYSNGSSNIIGSAAGGKGIVAVAQSQYGTTSNAVYRDGYKKITGEGGLDEDTAWCAMFVTWCANECGYVDSVISPNLTCENMADDLCSDRGYAYYRLCDTVVNTKNNGKGYVPVPGDIIFYCENGQYSLEHIHHVGFVASCVNGVMMTIEGNTKAGHKEYGVWNRTMTFNEWTVCMDNNTYFTGRVCIVHVPWPNQEADISTQRTQFNYIVSQLMDKNSRYGYTSQQKARQVAAGILANVFAATGCQADYEGTDAAGKTRYGLGYWTDAKVEEMRTWYGSEHTKLDSKTIRKNVNEILGTGDTQKEKEENASKANYAIQLDFLLYDIYSNSNYSKYLTQFDNKSEEYAVKCIPYFFLKEEQTSEMQNKIEEKASNYYKQFAT